MNEPADAAMIVNIHEAKTHLSRLLERVQAGEEIVIAKAGVPCARLAPLHPRHPSRTPGRLGGRLDDSFFESLPDEELAGWSS
jgi:prevent-host-death family protein